MLRVFTTHVQTCLASNQVDLPKVELFFFSWAQIASCRFCMFSVARQARSLLPEPETRREGLRKSRNQGSAGCVAFDWMKLRGSDAIHGSNVTAEQVCLGQHLLTSVERPSYLRSDFVNVWRHARLVIYIYLWLMYAFALICLMIWCLFRGLVLLIQSSLDWFNQEDATASVWKGCLMFCLDQAC